MSEYFETSDGEKFFKEDTAKLHAKSLEDKTVKTVTKTVKSESAEPETAKEILAAIGNMDLATIERFLIAENAKEAPRKTVTEALEKRLNELKNPA